LDTDLNQAFKSNFPFYYYDVTSGSNHEGSAGTAYDKVTGIGVPKGTDIGNRFFGFP
jgi:hypothetical protein